MKAAVILSMAAALADARLRAPDAAPKVNVTLYSESLCPDCIHFITGAWIDVWNMPGIGGTNGIISWNQVVYGNAQTVGQRITCQHGPTECTNNLIQTCAIAHAKGNVSAWLPFIHCMETHGDSQQKYAPQCAASAGLDWNEVNSCATSSAGLTLELQAGVITNSLNPPHQFVPWVTLGSTPGTFCSNSNCDNFLQAVCDAYTGTKPSGCSAAAIARYAERSAVRKSSVTGTCINPRA